MQLHAVNAPWKRVSQCNFRVKRKRSVYKTFNSHVQSPFSQHYLFQNWFLVLMIFFSSLFLFSSFITWHPIWEGVHTSQNCRDQQRSISQKHVIMKTPEEDNDRKVQIVLFHQIIFSPSILSKYSNLSLDWETSFIFFLDSLEVFLLTDVHTSLVSNNKYLFNYFIFLPLLCAIDMFGKMALT